MSLELEEVLQRRKSRIDAIAQNLSELCKDKTEISLEIGCGKGHYLSSYAANYPHEVCFGIDLISKRVKDAQRRAGLKNATNAFFVKAEASEFLEALPKEVSLTKIFIMFPDPWPKARHHKRRLIQNEFLDLLAKHSAKNCILYYRTDFNEYFDWTKEIFSAHDKWQILENEVLPFEEVSQFQRILPVYQTLVAKNISK